MPSLRRGIAQVAALQLSAALRLAEDVTLVADDHPTEQDSAVVREVLSDDEVSVLTWAAITINAFNRVSIMSGHPVGAREAE